MLSSKRCGKMRNILRVIDTVYKFSAHLSHFHDVTIPTMHIIRHIANDMCITVMKSPYLEGSKLSIEPIIIVMVHIATDILMAIPICLESAMMPEASPRLEGGTEDIIVLLFGAENIANPNPIVIIVAYTR